MRIVAKVESVHDGWTITLSSPDDATWNVAPRTLEGTAGPKFPLPPRAEWPDLSDKIRALLNNPAYLEQLRNNCLAGDPGKDGPALFGGYLHSVLFGREWVAVEKLAGEAALEIGLEIAADASEFANLPWEMMHAPSSANGEIMPLAAHPERPIAIVRLVVGETPETEPHELPLRVLFVVGRQLDNALRPGAEYLGLLRRLGLPTAGSAGNARINLWLLTETTSDELEAAVENFKPHVVHFIC